MREYTYNNSYTELQYAIGRIKWIDSMMAKINIYRIFPYHVDDSALDNLCDERFELLRKIEAWRNEANDADNKLTA